MNKIARDNEEFAEMFYMFQMGIKLHELLFNAKFEKMMREARNEYEKVSDQLKSERSDK